MNVEIQGKFLSKHSHRVQLNGAMGSTELMKVNESFPKNIMEFSTTHSERISRRLRR